MMRNQQDIEKQLKRFPKQHLSETSKERIQNSILNADSRSSRRQTRPHKRTSRIAVWAASIAAVLLFGLLGSSYIMDEDPVINSPAGEHLGMGGSQGPEKAIPEIAQDENENKNENKNDNQQDSTDETTDTNEAADQTDSQSNTEEETDQADTESKSESTEPDIIDQSRTIIKALDNRDMDTLAKHVHPEKGLLFSPYVYVTDDAVVVDKQDVGNLMQTDETYTWGNYDGKGTPIEMTPKQYFDEFVDMAPFVNGPDNILIDEQKKRGNTKNNIKEVFPDSKVVEFYDSGSEEYAGIDWNSVNLVYETDAEGSWRLVAIVRDAWTV